ncbi:hypothetical protein JR316_0000340 [Psilocybe cubensis]|uniref:Uncharacterized protein n=2 Tax=Psilocybe cubensis TaxID=181762 RepID=A0ACB8HEB7_PSICU|nr:hypothetical protein JR316_0000340 [Psilocybe cubensis]KAH9486276.1 hypothetical protein JR316_0000340 [Psilocybe cubensis]
MDKTSPSKNKSGSSSKTRSKAKNKPDDRVPRSSWLDYYLSQTGFSDEEIQVCRELTMVRGSQSSKERDQSVLKLELNGIVIAPLPVKKKRRRKTPQKHTSRGRDVNSIEQQHFLTFSDLTNRYFRFCGTPSYDIGALQEESAILDKNIEHHVFQNNKWFPKHSFGDSAAFSAEIRDFMSSSPLWDDRNQRWLEMPNHPKAAEDLHAPLINLITAVMQRFRGFERRTIQTNRDFYSNSLDATPAQQVCKFIPDIAILDPSLSPLRPAGSGRQISSTYVNCISPILVTLRSKKAVDKNHHLGQMNRFAWQCFLAQDNREIVYGLHLLGPGHFQCYSFDRSGVHCGPVLETSLDAVEFVRTIIALACYDIGALGFNKNVYWGLEGKRYLKTVDAESRATRYVLTDTRPVFRSHCLQGRGTSIWSTKDSNGKHIFIRDSWYTTGGFPEEGFLEAAEQLVPLGPCITTERKELVSKMRNLEQTQGTIESPHENVFWDRVLTRTTFEDTSAQLSGFGSPKGLLSYLGDIFRWHQNVSRFGFEYRWRRVSTISLPIEKSPVGLPMPVEMNLAYWLNRSTSILGVFHKQESLGILPLNSLKDHLQVPRPPKGSYDHLDTIESLFYALCWVTIGYSNLSQAVYPIPNCLQEWDASNPSISYYSKIKMWTQDEFLHASEVTPFFGPVFADLLKQIYLHLKPYVTYKCLPIVAASPLINADRDYSCMLSLVDGAFKNLENVSAGVAITEEALSNGFESDITWPSPQNKRPLERDDEDGQKPSSPKKRQRRSSKDI